MTSESQISDYLCSEKGVFNLSQRVLTEAGTKFLEKVLNYAPIQKKINESELGKDFLRSAGVWEYFRNEPTPQFSEVSCFKSKSSWRPPNGHPPLKIFLRKIEKDLFDICKKQQTCSKFNSEEWKAMRSLADDRNIVIKKRTKDLSW